MVWIVGTSVTGRPVWFGVATPSSVQFVVYRDVDGVKEFLQADGTFSTVPYYRPGTLQDDEWVHTFIVPIGAAGHFLTWEAIPDANLPPISEEKWVQRYSLDDIYLRESSGAPSSQPYSQTPDGLPGRSF